MKIKNLAELRQIGKVKIFDEIDFEVKNKKLFYEIRGNSSGLYLGSDNTYNSEIFELEFESNVESIKKPEQLPKKFEVGELRIGEMKQ